VCTVVIIRRPGHETPLFIAANRDEFYERPSKGPKLWPSPPAFIAPQDLRAGGTWLALSAERYVVAITNQRTLGPPNPTKTSRGDLVIALARAGSPSMARALLASVNARDYNPFNLFVGDAQQAFVGYGRADANKIELEEVPHGLHVLPNDHLDSKTVRKVARIHDLAGDFPAIDDPEVLTGRLITLMRDRQPSSSNDELSRALDAVCIETPTYGSRSSAIIAVATTRCDYGGPMVRRTRAST